MPVNDQKALCKGRLNFSVSQSVGLLPNKPMKDIKSSFVLLTFSAVCARTPPPMFACISKEKTNKQWLYSLEESHPLNSWFLWLRLLLRLHHTSPLIKLSELSLWSRIRWHTKNHKCSQIRHRERSQSTAWSEKRSEQSQNTELLKEYRCTATLKLLITDRRWILQTRWLLCDWRKTTTTTSWERIYSMKKINFLLWTFCHKADISTLFRYSLQ